MTWHVESASRAVLRWVEPVDVLAPARRVRLGHRRLPHCPREPVIPETDSLYYQLVEAAPDAMLVFDANGPRCLLADAAAERLLGYGRAELLRLRPVDLLEPDQLP